MPLEMLLAILAILLVTVPFMLLVSAVLAFGESLRGQFDMAVYFRSQILERPSRVPNAPQLGQEEP